MSMYSLCSFHWTHMRIPSSKNVETRQKRARWGRTCFVLLVTYNRQEVNSQTDNRDNKMSNLSVRQTINVIWTALPSLKGRIFFPSNFQENQLNADGCRYGSRKIGILNRPICFKSVLWIRISFNADLDQVLISMGIRIQIQGAKPMRMPILVRLKSQKTKSWSISMLLYPDPQSQYGSGIQDR